MVIFGGWEGWEVGVEAFSFRRLEFSWFPGIQPTDVVLAFSMLTIKRLRCQMDKQNHDHLNLFGNHRAVSRKSRRFQRLHIPLKGYRTGQVFRSDGIS